MTDKITLLLDRIAQTFHKAGYQCYLVGGAVRSELLGTTTQDYDIATNAVPQIIMKLFKRVIPTGIKHGTVTVLLDDMAFEVTTFRTDGKYSDGRRPDSICFIPNILEDLRRRDFTINSIAYDLINKTYFDPNNGKDDLQKRLIRAIGNPTERFNEDGLRPLRALRFVAQLGFHLDEATYKAITDTIAVTALVSKERIAEELFKLCLAPHAEKALFLLRDCGLMQILLPELYACGEVNEDANYHTDILTHQIKTLSYVPPQYKKARIAALFHDIGKIPTRLCDSNGKAAYYGHDIIGADLITKIGRRYHRSIAGTTAVSHLVRYHAFSYNSSWSDAAVRRFVINVGFNALDDLFALKKADIWASCGEVVPIPELDELKNRIKELHYHKNIIFSLHDLAVNGSDLLNAGFHRGPLLGKILNKLFDKVIEEPELNTKNQLLNLAIQIKEQA
jgi:tRNA nucleotidyltransferase (CCA-adding enzyme)